MKYTTRRRKKSRNGKSRRRRHYKMGQGRHRRQAQQGGMLRVPLPTRADVARLQTTTAAPKQGPMAAPDLPPQKRKFFSNFFSKLFKNMWRKKAVPVGPSMPIQAPSPPPPQPPVEKYADYVVPRSPRPSPKPLSSATVSAINAAFEGGPEQAQLRYLQGICDRANTCIAFGNETTRLNKFFAFSTFKYAANMRVISSGSNGFTVEIKYARENYKADALLKSAIDTEADNIYLEAYNGLKYINRYALQFPCFLETYGAFMYKNGASDRDSLQRYARIGGLYATDFAKNQLKEIFQPLATSNGDGGGLTYDVERAGQTCQFNGDFAVLIQYIEGAMSLETWFDKYKYTNGYEYQVELPIILFQIYATLSSLSGKFTHYDLHAQNVLIYTVPDGGYVEMQFKNAIYWKNHPYRTPTIEDEEEDKHLTEEQIRIKYTTITLKTRYIVKIIDYGRTYCPDNAKIHNMLCEAPSCNMVKTDRWRRTIKDSCGVLSGYPFFGLYGFSPDDFYINRQHYSNSHDLRLIRYLIDMYRNDLSIRDFLKHDRTNHIKIIMQNVHKKYRTAHGTLPVNTYTRPTDFFTSYENIKNSGNSLPHDVTTVNDVYWALLNLIIIDPWFNQTMLEHTQNRPLYGTLTINLAFDIKNIHPTVFIKEMSRPSTLYETGPTESPPIPIEKPISPQEAHDINALVDVEL